MSRWAVAVVAVVLGTSLAGVGAPAQGAPTGASPSSPATSPGSAHTMAVSLLPGAVRALDRNAAGVGPNDGVVSGALSPGGLFFAFWSKATNLWPGVADGRYHLYVSEVATGKVLGVADTNLAGTVLSNDASTGGGWRLVSWVPRAAGQVDSTRILFTSYATNLGPTPPAVTGPFLYERNLSDATPRLKVYPVGGVRDAYYSPSRAKIVFSTSLQYGTDTNGGSDIWVLDPSQSPASNTYLRSVSSSSTYVIPPDYYNSDSTRPVWSPDSTKIAFQSSARSLVPNDTNASIDIFVKTLATGAIKRVSTRSTGGQGNNHSEWPSWSPDGTRIAFDSAADNLVTGDANSSGDIFVKNISTGAISLVSTNYQGKRVIAVNGHRVPKWSPDGTRIAFQTAAVNMMPTLDTNQRTDVYIKNLSTGAVQLASVNADGRFGNGASELWRLEGPNSAVWRPGGRGIAFLSYATNFPGTQRNGFALDAFVKVM